MKIIHIIFPGLLRFALGSIQGRLPTHTWGPESRLSRGPIIIIIIITTTISISISPSSFDCESDCHVLSGTNNYADAVLLFDSSSQTVRAEKSIPGAIRRHCHRDSHEHMLYGEFIRLARD